MENKQSSRLSQNDTPFLYHSIHIKELKKTYMDLVVYFNQCSHHFITDWLVVQLFNLLSPAAPANPQILGV